MKTTESALYQLGRDVNGVSHCYITYYTPGVTMTIVFPGWNGAQHREDFITAHLQGHGWATTAVTSNELLVRNGLPAIEIDPDRDGGGFGEVLYITATK